MVSLTIRFLFEFVLACCPLMNSLVFSTTRFLFDFMFHSLAFLTIRAIFEFVVDYLVPLTIRFSFCIRAGLLSVGGFVGVLNHPFSFRVRVWWDGVGVLNHPCSCRPSHTCCPQRGAQAWGYYSMVHIAISRICLSVRLHKAHSCWRNASSMSWVYVRRAFSVRTCVHVGGIASPPLTRPSPPSPNPPPPTHLPPPTLHPPPPFFPFPTSHARPPPPKPDIYINIFILCMSIRITYAIHTYVYVWYTNKLSCSFIWFVYAFILNRQSKHTVVFFWIVYAVLGTWTSTEDKFQNSFYLRSPILSKMSNLPTRSSCYSVVWSLQFILVSMFLRACVYIHIYIYIYIYVHTCTYTCIHQCRNKLCIYI